MLYNLGWKLAAVLEGTPEALLASYEEERRPIAAEMLGLSTRLLEAARKRGAMRRGRETHQLDLGYRDSSLALNQPPRPAARLLAGDRAPDAPVRGAAGQATRLFKCFQGPHWTLLGYEVDNASTIAPRNGLHIHIIGQRGELVDEGHVRESYGLSPGDWVLVRPDGYIGAIVSSRETAVLEGYLDKVGLRAV